jgi:hypothetical protein
MSRINWAVTTERILIWLRLAETHDRDVSDTDRARRRAQLGRARLRLHLLQSNKAATWRIRRAHQRVIRHVMRSAQHTGLADFPNAANEREATQMYTATLYGAVEATAPNAVTHLNAWQRNAATTSSSNTPHPAAAAEHNETDSPTRDPASAPTAHDPRRGTGPNSDHGTEPRAATQPRQLDNLARDSSRPRDSGRRSQL